MLKANAWPHNKKSKISGSKLKELLRFLKKTFPDGMG